MSPPSWNSLPPPTPSHLSRLSQNPGLSFWSYIAHFHWLSVSHMVVNLNTVWTSMRVPVSSVQLLSHVDSLQPHGLQHARLLCSSPTPGACSNSCPSSRWCHPTISSSIIPFSSHFQSFPASGSFQMSQCFASGGQSIGVSASISVLPMNIQDLFPLGWTGFISLQPKGLSRVFSTTTVQKHQCFCRSRWQSGRRTCAHLLLRELQNYNPL